MRFDFFLFSGPTTKGTLYAQYTAAKRQAKEYDTYGKKRKFTTVQGIELNLPSGAYGWKTDREEETKALTEAIQNGETVDKEPVYISKGAQKGSNDIGNSYVEIDLTNQHLYLFIFPYSHGYSSEQHTFAILHAGIC